MNCKNFTFVSQDGTKIYVNKWFSEEAYRPKAIIQISHGMAEHVDRYKDFAKALVEEGFVVYANDHRGHGKTAASLENIGYFADENGWDLVIEDIHQLTNIIKKEYPSMPIIIFGHSMGSLLSRAYIQLYGEDINGAIISGTAGDKGLLVDIGILVAKIEIKRIGKKAKSKILDKLLFGNFNRRFKPNRTNFDWLSRDTEQVDKYIKDKFCGEVFTAGFYYDFLTGIKNLNKAENMKKIPINLPIYLLSGEKDPVGKNTKGVLEVYHTYKKIGIEDVSYTFYKEGRHEMLNEMNREEVYKDIIHWINNHL